MTKFFENIREGDIYKFGSRTVTKEEIREFAKKYDPQPFHVDEEAAEDSFFGTLVASGMHTLAVCMRIAVDGYYTDVANVAGTRMDEVRFSQPLHPGDTLTVSSEILEKSPAHSPNLGTIRSHWTATNQDDETVLTLEMTELVRRREPLE